MECHVNDYGIYESSIRVQEASNSQDFTTRRNYWEDLPARKQSKSNEHHFNFGFTGSMVRVHGKSGQRFSYFQIFRIPPRESIGRICQRGSQAKVTKSTFILFERVKGATSWNVMSRII